MTWRGAVLAVMRVPHQPEPPPGSPPRVFRAAPNYLTLKTVQWAIAQVALIIPVMILTGASAFAGVVAVLAVVGWIVYLFQAVFSWAVMRLDYELRWYMLSDRAIRIREGIGSVREKTMALANVQNISIRQGPLQRLLGIADVEVTTAGGGGPAASAHGKKGVGEPMHIAYFRGVDNAEQIRDLVREGVRRQKDAGLGDPDDHQSAPDADAAITELLREARKLRAVAEEAAARR